jgi:small-conductance mechanosensitive channel
MRIALIIIFLAIATVYFGNTPWQKGFVLGTTLLMVWYVILTVIPVGIFVASKVFESAWQKLVAGKDEKSFLNQAVDAVHIEGFIGMFFFTGVPIFGIYLLMTSGNAEMSFSEFSSLKLLIGTHLLLCGITYGRN